MKFDDYLDDLRRTEFYKGQIVHTQHVPPREAEYGKLERPLHPDLQDRLEQLERKRLYTHQADAVNAARDGEHVTIVTATASGKTLCYNLP